ncbi:hypothetical protein EON63_08185, partial [archaeon]
MRWITLGWVGFITENLVVSHNRDYLIHNFGDDEYHIVYNVLSTAACSSIAYGFFRYGKFGGSTLPSRGPLAHTVAFAIQALGLAGLSQLAPALQVPVAFRSDAVQPNPVPSMSSNSLNTSQSAQQPEHKMYVRCPIDFRPKQSEDGIYGIERITRHPALWFGALTLLGPALVTPYMAHVSMCTFPTLFALIGGEHQDYRYRRGSGGMLPPEVDSVTSNVPFAAFIRGKQSLQKLLDEVKWTNAALG